MNSACLYIWPVVQRHRSFSYCTAQRGHSHHSMRALIPSFKRADHHGSAVLRTEFFDIMNLLPDLRGPLSRLKHGWSRSSGMRG